MKHTTQGVFGLLLAGGVVFITLTGCQKELSEPVFSSLCVADGSVHKSVGDSLVGVVVPEVVNFTLCPGNIPLRTDASGTIRYGCDSPRITSRVNIQDGYGSTIC